MSKTPFALRHLVCASKIGDANMVRGILRQSPEAARDWRPIMEASYNGFPKVVELLVKYGSDVNAVSTSEHNRPLHRAVEKNHLDVVEVLLRSGADIETRATWLHITPLVKAAFDGHSRIVDFLLEHGAKVDRFSAAAIGRTRTARDGVDTNGLTTLHYCAGSALERPEVVKIAARLIASGADPCAKARAPGHAITPIKLAIHNQPVADLLLNHGADPNDVYRDVLLSTCSDFDFAGTLLDRGAVLNPVLWGGETLLHLSIHWGRLSSAEWLLNNGADPNTKREKDSWTPLHQAASRGVASIVETLLKHGADPKRKDVSGHTPLDIAQAKKRAAVVKLLI